MIIGVLLGVFPLVVGSSSWAETLVDNTRYAELLEKYVHDGVVNYRDLKTEELKLDQYLDLLNRTNPNELARDEQFAFYMNAYNAYTLKLIVEHYPVKSIKDIGGLFRSPWKIKFCKVGGETLTLDDIEHQILRPRFQDARVHFAINCAAKDCPPLSALRNAGTQLEEVGKTLKANRWQRFRYITLPIMLPSLLASSLIVFAYTFGAFEIPYLLGQTYPMLLPVRAYKNYADVDLMARPEGIALGMLIAGFIVCVMVITQRITRPSGERG